MFNVSDSSYDNFMGRFSVPLAPLFADFAGIEAGQRVLDVGAGTGALTAELVRRGAERSAADPSPPLVATLLEVEAGYSGIDEFWNALADGAGPAGVWAASLDDAQRLQAREEIYRQVGEPKGSFTLVGRAWAAKATRA